MKIQHYTNYILISYILFTCACERTLDIGLPKNQLTTSKVFVDANSAKAALFNVYVQLERSQYNLCNKYLATYVDETVSASLQDWNQSRLSGLETFNLNNWTELYADIYQCNSIFEQLENSLIAPNIKNQIAAEAKFLRAYAYFYLVNLYGKVPLVTGTNVEVSRKLARSSMEDVYTLILKDLVEARNTISIPYPDGGSKIRANKACVTALLAKVYLYLGNWGMAETLADELIQSGTYTPLENTENVFKIGSKESILQLSTQNGFVTESGTVIPSSATAIPNFFFTDNFYLSFEGNDLRKTNWIGTNSVSLNGNTTIYRYPNKYKNRVTNTTNPENLIVLRVAEQYLIRAEARAQLNRLTGSNSALSDLNILRARAGLPDIFPALLSDVLAAIYTERKHEMFFENADRFMDLKRTGNIKNVMTTAKTTWTASAALLPIPTIETTFNPNIIPNDGY